MCVFVMMDRTIVGIGFLFSPNVSVVWWRRVLGFCCVLWMVPVMLVTTCLDAHPCSFPRCIFDSGEGRLAGLFYSPINFDCETRIDFCGRRPTTDRRGPASPSTLGKSPRPTHARGNREVPRANVNERQRRDYCVREQQQQQLIDE